MILLLLVQRDFDLNIIWKIVFVASSSCSRILSSTPSPSISSAPEMSPTRIRSRIRPILTKPPNVYPARKCFCRYLINVCVCVFVCVCVQGEGYGRVEIEMAGSILCMSYCCWLGFFLFVCQCDVHCPGKQHHNRIILSKKAVARQSVFMCAIYARVGMG